MANEAGGTEDRPWASQRLVEAEVGLADALRRLHSVRRDTMRGGCSLDELARARLAYRAAEAAVADARAGAATLHPTDPTLAFVPSKRQEFARWLYREGRISDHA